MATMSTNSNVVHNTNLDRYVVIHVATTCDEHGVYVTKDSAEVIELGWILLNAKTLEEVWQLSTPLEKLLRCAGLLLTKFFDCRLPAIQYL
jgi:hypothetical protein